MVVNQYKTLTKNFRSKCLLIINPPTTMLLFKQFERNHFNHPPHPHHYKLCRVIV